MIQLPEPIAANEKLTPQRFNKLIETLRDALRDQEQARQTVDAMQMAMAEMRPIVQRVSRFNFSGTVRGYVTPGGVSIHGRSSKQPFLAKITSSDSASAQVDFDAEYLPISGSATEINGRKGVPTDTYIMVWYEDGYNFDITQGQGGNPALGAVGDAFNATGHATDWHVEDQGDTRGMYHNHYDLALGDDGTMSEYNPITAFSFNSSTNVLTLRWRKAEFTPKTMDWWDRYKLYDADGNLIYIEDNQSVATTYEADKYAQGDEVTSSGSTEIDLSSLAGGGGSYTGGDHITIDGSDNINHDSPAATSNTLTVAASLPLQVTGDTGIGWDSFGHVTDASSKTATVSIDASSASTYQVMQKKSDGSVDFDWVRAH